MYVHNFRTCKFQEKYLHNIQKGQTLHEKECCEMNEWPIWLANEYAQPGPSEPGGKEGIPPYPPLSPFYFGRYVNPFFNQEGGRLILLGDVSSNFSFLTQPIYPCLLLLLTLFRKYPFDGPTYLPLLGDVLYGWSLMPTTLLFPHPPGFSDIPTSLTVYSRLHLLHIRPSSAMCGTL